MAVWSETFISETIDQNRIDSEFYRPYNIELFNKLIECNHVKLKRIAYITDGIHDSPDVVNSGGVQYISAKCVKNNEFITDNCIYISETQNQKNPRTQLQSRDVIITTVGTIGNVAVVDETLLPSNCDRHVGIIRCNDPNISPYYLSTFLNSKYGIFQSIRESAGNVQLNLYIKNIGNILIPRNKSVEKSVDTLTKKSYQKRKQSKTLYTQAQELLENELGLNPLVLERHKSYETNFSELVKFHRMDGEFYDTKYESYLNAIINYKYGHLPLKYSIDIISPNLVKTNNTNHTFEYLQIGDINISDGSYSTNTVEGLSLPANAKIRLSGGEILISQVRPTRGAIAIIDNIVESNTVASGAFFAFKMKDEIYKEITWLFLRLLKSVFEKYCTGTSYPTIDGHYLANFPTPAFQEKIAKNIKDLVIRSKQAKKESEQLLAQAKQKVEDLIEGVCE